MKSAATLLAVTALASVATANAALSYGQPIQATVWTAGATETVSWTTDCSDLPATVFDIVLQVQQGTLQVPVAGLKPIGSLDCSGASSTTVQIPATITTGSTYSILVVNGGIQSYSAQFTINGVAGGNATTTAPAVVSSSASASTVSATATGTSTATGTKTNGTSTATSTPTTTTKPNGAGALMTGSTAALAVVAAAIGLML